MQQLSILVLDRDNIKISNTEEITTQMLVANPIKVVVGNTKTLKTTSVHQLIDEGWLIFSSGNRRQASDITIITILDNYSYLILEITLITSDLKLGYKLMNTKVYEQILRHWYNPLTKGWTTVYRSSSYKKRIFI